MKRTFLQRLLMVLVFFLLSLKCYAANKTLQNKALPDSIQTQLAECDTDTCVFIVIRNLIKKHGMSNFKTLEYYTLLLNDKLKNSSSPYIQYECHQRMAIIHRYNGDLDAAEKENEIAFQIAKKNNFKDNEIECMIEFGHLYLSKADYHQAKTYYKSALSQASNKNQQRYAYTQLGNMFEVSGRYDSAVHYHNLSYEISKDLKNNGIKIQHKLSLAKAYINNNQQEKAISLYNSVSDELKLIKSSHALISTHCQIGEFISSILNNYNLAIDYFLLAESLINKSEPLSSYCNIYNNLAYNNLKLGNDSAANQYFKLSNSVALETNCPHYKREALNDKAQLCKEKRKYGEAQNLWLELITHHCPCCSEISFHEPLIEVADIYLSNQQYDSAMNYYQKSLDIAQRSNALKEQAISNLKIGNLYVLINETDKCENHYLLASKLAKSSRNLQLIKSVSDTVSHFYNARKKYELAYKSQENSLLIADSISKLLQSQSLVKLGSKLSANLVKSKMDKEIAVSNSRLQHLTAYKNYLLLVLVIIIGLGAFYYRRYVIKKEQLIILRKQKEEFILSNIELLNKYRETKLELDKLIVQKNKIESIHFQLNNTDDTLDANPDSLILHKCIEIIKQNIENSNFSVDILAQKLNLSKSNLYRKINGITDYNPAELIRNIRMKHAAELLKKTELRVYEVAFASGYEDAVKFSQAFKKAYGKLPSEFVQDLVSVA